MTALMLHLAFSIVAAQGPQVLIREGSSPQLALSPNGTIYLVFGKQDTIFAATSTDMGKGFGAPVIVGVVHKMHLGNTRGPVVASSRNHSLIAAGDQAGNIHLFQLNHTSGGWTILPRTLNDAAGSAPEGLLTIAAGSDEKFHGVWLDVRLEKRNQLFYSQVALTGGRVQVAPSVQIYKSTDAAPCECCRPSVAVRGTTVAVMFRNSLNGFRDMYYTASRDGGRTFSTAAKLGTGTWKLDACPMDGGALAIKSSGELATVWRRENTVYYAEPGKNETALGQGRSPMMSLGPLGTAVLWQTLDSLKLATLGSQGLIDVGRGRMPQILALPDNSLLTAWDANGKVYVRRLP